MKAGKTLKLAGALAASLALLVMFAGCGQSSSPKSSSQKEASSSSTPAKSASAVSPSTAGASSSNPRPVSSSSSAATPSPTPSSAPSFQSAPSTTQSMPSNEVLYLLAYIKYRGGLEAITPSDLIVDKYMIGTQKGTVLPTTPPTPPTQVPLQMVVSGEEVKVIGPAPPPTPESDAMYSLKALYSIDSLVSEYYSTPSQKEQVNSILQEGERHNLLDVLAVLKSQAISGTDYNGQQLVIANTSLGDNNNLGSGAGINTIIVIKGGEVSVCKTSSSQYNDPVYYYYYHFTSQSLINEYYFTPVQKAHIDEDISQGTNGYTPSSWGL